MEPSGQHHSPAVLHLLKNPRRLCGTQSLSGRSEDKTLSPKPEFELRTDQPVTTYTDTNSPILLCLLEGRKVSTAHQVGKLALLIK